MSAPLPPGSVVDALQSTAAEQAPEADAAAPYPARHWAVTGLFLLALVAALHAAKHVLLPVVLAVLLYFLLSPAVRGLKRTGIAEPIGAGIILLVAVLTIGASLATLAQPASEWLQRAPQAMAEADRKLRSIKQTFVDVKRATDRVERLTSLDGSSTRNPVVVKEAPKLSELIMNSTHKFVLSAFSTLMLTFFLLASGDLFLRKIVSVLPRLRDRRRAVEVGRTMQKEVGRYFLLISAINLGLGASTAILMFALGLPNAALWGVLVAVLNFVPYLGPLLSLGVLTGAALLSFDSLDMIWPVPLSFAVLALIEGQLLQPILAGRTMALNPVFIFVSFLFWGWLWGLPGMLIAVPILIVLKVMCNHLPGLGGLGLFLDRR
ncbi:MAG: AI-2E family transporter [Moraxellaceae bacterium]|nr:AI-2E family transporter [Moraxellaceae bacterium]